MSDAINAAPAAAPQAAPEAASQEANENIETQELDASQAAEQSPEQLAETKKQVEQEMKKLGKKKLKLKVDGKDVEEELDLDDEAGLVKQIQLAKAAQKRMQESATLKKQIEDFMSALGKNPDKALRDLGLDVDSFAESVIAKKIEEMQKSPEQLEREKMQREIEDLRQKIQAEEKAKRDLEMSKAEEQAMRQLDEEIGQALDKMTTLPKSPYIIKRVADTMLIAMQNGYENVKAEDVMGIVEKQIKSELSDMFGAMPEEILESVVGRPNLDRLRKKRVAATKPAIQQANQVKNAKDTGRTETNNSAKPQEKIPMRDFFKNLGK